MIFIDVAKALDAGNRTIVLIFGMCNVDAGIKFFLSDNGVVLTEGNERGFLLPEYFQRIEDAKRVEITGWNAG